jgi:hypothetical protein
LTDAAYGTSHEGFKAEWRFVENLTVEGDLINRGETFDETDIGRHSRDSTNSIRAVPNKC